MAKRLFDVFCSLIGMLILLPFFILISFLVIFSSRGGVFYRQTRVGKNGRDFTMYKFRTMFSGSEKKGLLTIGNRDNRITRVGYFLRKYKLDELPQLWNVFTGTMSMVGPRPEVRKYVELYNDDQKKVLSIKPGITDYASLEYSGESELLATASDPEKLYVDTVMPTKLKLNQKYMSEKSLRVDSAILIKTLLKIVSIGKS